MESIFLDELKKFMELDENTTDNDDILNISLNAAQAFIDGYCNITTSPRQEVLTLSGDGTDTIYTDFLPISTVDTVSIDNTAYDVLDFYISRNNISSLSNTFTTGIRNIELTITVGYATIEDMPHDLLLALLKIAEKYYTDAAENRDGVDSYNTSTKVGEKFYQSQLPSGVKPILALHKRYVL